MAGEVWRIVPIAPQFMASSEGRIMVAPFLGEMPNGGIKHYGGSPHFGVWSKRDSRFIIVHKGRTFKVHRLVCEAFNGASPFDGAVVMHLDENSANNRPDNLAWGTQAENLKAATHSGYLAGRNGKRTLAYRDSALPKGVSEHKASGKFAAYAVGHDGRQKHLGLFRTLNEAELAVEHFHEAKGLTALARTTCPNRDQRTPLEGRGKRKSEEA